MTVCLVSVLPCQKVKHKLYQSTEPDGSGYIVSNGSLSSQIIYRKTKKRIPRKVRYGRGKVWTNGCSKGWINGRTDRREFIGSSARQVKHTQTAFVSKLPTNCLSVFDHFVGLGLKGLSNIDCINKEKQIIWLYILGKYAQNTEMFLISLQKRQTQY